LDYEMSDMITVVPSVSSSLVTEFCKFVSPGQTPQYVNVVPESYCIENCCFQNVVQKVKKDCGGIVYGWQIWMMPELLIEAEFHAVWKSPLGELIDITPKTPATDKILFISDELKKYDGSRTNNIRKNISKSKVVDMFIRISDCLFMMEKKGSQGEFQIILEGDERKFYAVLCDAKQKYLLMVKAGHTREDKCFCNSGKKHKNCCEKGILNIVRWVEHFY